MAQLNFTQQLARFMALPQVQTDARQLRAGPECAFAAHPRLRSYVLDEQGHLRENVCRSARIVANDNSSYLMN